jgi:predicted DNA-binding transcriptional regulator YafY
MESSRLSRALRLLNLLQSGHGATAEYLAHALSCSKRTVFRDIKLLNDNNIRVWYDERLGGYTSEHQLWALAASMDDEEYVSLLVAAILSPFSQMKPFSGVVDQAVAKMMGRGSLETRNRVNRLIRGVIPPQSQPELSVAEHTVFEQLIRAIVNRIQVRLRYIEGGDGPRRSTKFSTYQLAVQESRWTAVGRSTWHRGIIRLKLLDIQDLVFTQDSYEVPVEYLQEGPTGNAFSPPPAAPLGRIPPPPGAENLPEEYDEDDEDEEDGDEEDEDEDAWEDD